MIAWKADIEDPQFYLHASETANLKVTAKGVEGLSPSHCPTPFMAYETKLIQRINTTIEIVHEMFLIVILEHLVDLILCRLTYAGADVAVKLEEEPSGLPLKVITKYMLCSPISMYCLKPWMPFDNKSRVWHSIDEKSWISVFGSDHNTMEVLTFICPSFGRC